MSSERVVLGRHVRNLILLAQVVIVVQYVSASCTEQEFQCNSSECIPRHLMCNGQNDCDDSSDEINCTNRESCDEDEFECIDRICISSSLVCNGGMDCPRGLDEMNCVQLFAATPTLSTPPTSLGILRSADGHTIISFPIYSASPSFRVYLRFTAQQCKGHLLELTSQTSDQFLLLSLNNQGRLDFFFKTSLGVGLINLHSPSGASFCSGKMYLLTLRRELDKVVFRVNRGKRVVKAHRFLKTSFPSMNKINVGFGLDGCVSGIDMLYYNSAKVPHPVGFSKGCVFSGKSSQTPTASSSSINLERLSSLITTLSTRSRIRKSDIHTKHGVRSLSLPATEPLLVMQSIVTNKKVTQHVAHSTTEMVTESVPHSITEAVTHPETKAVTQHITNDVMSSSSKPESVTRYVEATQPIPAIITQSTNHRERECRQRPSICAGSGLKKTNTINKNTDGRAERQIRSFLPFIRANCSSFLRAFLCTAFFPSCSIAMSQSTTIKPCRELCLRTKDECSTLMNAFEFKWPDALRCERFPSISGQQCFIPELMRATTIQRTLIPATLGDESVDVGAKPTKKKRCGGILTSRAGLISSPNYPHPYPPNTLCQWTIFLPRIYRIINLLVEDASMEADNKCGYDYLLFRDGLSNQVDSKICGFMEYPRLVTIKGNIAVIVFKSDSAVNKKGFLISYEAHWK